MRAYLLGLFRPRRPMADPSGREVIATLREAVAAKSIKAYPVMDDVDAGYEMAIDEVLDLIDGYEKSAFLHHKKQEMKP
jgi:hypothetical protein